MEATQWAFTRKLGHQQLRTNYSRPRRLPGCLHPRNLSPKSVPNDASSCFIVLRWEFFVFLSIPLLFQPAANLATCNIFFLKQRIDKHPAINGVEWKIASTLKWNSTINFEIVLLTQNFWETKLSHPPYTHCINVCAHIKGTRGRITFGPKQLLKSKSWHSSCSWRKIESWDIFTMTS